MIEKITPDGYIGIQVSSTRNDASQIWEERLIKEIQATSSYPVVHIQMPGMGAAAGGPTPDIIELIRNAFEVAGYLGAMWKAEQFLRRKKQAKLDNIAKGYAQQREYLYITLTHGDLVPDSVVRRLTIRDLVSLLPTVRNVLKGVDNYSLMVMGKSKYGEQINFFNLDGKDLQGKPLRRMIKVANSERGPAGYSSEDLNMIIFKPNPKLR